jgi:hypothetical protein
MQAVRWRIRLDAYAADLSNVVSAALNVAESAGRCAIRRDAYDGGDVTPGHVGDAAVLGNRVERRRESGYFDNSQRNNLRSCVCGMCGSLLVLVQR